MHRFKPLIYLLLISTVIIVIDQLLKFMMLQVLTYGASIPIIKGFFSLTLVFNTGAAFGILQGKQIIFMILPLVTVIFILVYFIKVRDKQKLILPLSFIIGGTLGNYIDRIKYGWVVDFFDFYIKQWHWPAFNLADAFICFGVFLICITIIQKSDFKRIS